MADTPLTFILLCLGLVSLCMVAMTVTLMLTAHDIRRTMRRLHAMAPAADQALREAQRVLTHARRLLARAGGATRHVESVVQQACETATETLERFNVLKLNTARFLGKWVGNGTGAEPRRHHRRH